MRELIIAFGGLVKQLILITAAAGLLIFFWGLAKFLFRPSGDEKAVTEGKNIMIWGVIALFVMITVWGIISFFQSQFGIKAFL